VSGQGLPYRLRPNKFIDRELFAEFISLVVADSAPGRFAYISMGGDHLSDHLAMYRRAGINNLYAFDRSSDVVSRQQFNAPFEKVQCGTHESGEIPTRLESILSKFGAESSIIWLDYTEPKRLAQLKELEALAKKLQPGDIVRISFNADFSNLQKREANLKAADKDMPAPQKTAALLRIDLGSYFPNRVKEVYFTDINGALSLAVERALQNGLEQVPGDKKAIPVLLTEYQDTSRMFTATALIVDSEGAPSVPEGWAYKPTGWNDIQKIYAPDLSAKERYAVDRLMHKLPEQVAGELAFPLDQEAISSYTRFHRFYPSFQPVFE
jgi:hypothetical protein